MESQTVKTYLTQYHQVGSMETLRKNSGGGQRSSEVTRGKTLKTLLR